MTAIAAKQGGPGGDPGGDSADNPRVASLAEAVVSQLFCDLPRDEARWLISPSKHISILPARRAAIIISRVRLVSILLAAPDVLMLHWPMSDRLDMARLYTSIAFVVLAFSFKKVPYRMRDAHMALCALFAIPAIFCAYSFLLVSQNQAGDSAAFISAIYPFLPVVMVAGLGFFPFTILEAVLYAAPLLATGITFSKFHIGALMPDMLASPAWLAIIVFVIAVISGVSQLAFMISMGLTSFRDALTGCLSRASGMEMMGTQYSIASRGCAPMAVAFIDLDNFKSVNDRYGHDAGDKVLSVAAKIITSSLRTGDTLARWGGEEFVLIMPNTHINQAMLAIERLRAKGFGTRPDSQPLTASIGIAERVQDSTEDWETLVEIADRRMYEAKTTGKDRMVYASERIC